MDVLAKSRFRDRSRFSLAATALCVQGCTFVRTASREPQSPRVVAVLRAYLWSSLSRSKARFV